MKILSSSFFRNSAGSGGGVYISGSLNYLSSHILLEGAEVELINCELFENRATSRGGGLASAGYTKLVDTELKGNVAGGRGGGIGSVMIIPGNLTNRFGSLELIGCNLTENYCEAQSSYGGRDGGGAINVYSTTKVVLVDCVISGNSAAQYGGGLHLHYNSSVILGDCKIIKNGCGELGGGIYSSRNGHLSVFETHFDRNISSYSGGSVSLLSTNADYTNCLFTGNSAEFTGAGFYLAEGSMISITNCTAHGNRAQFGKFVSSTNRAGWHPDLEYITIRNSIIDDGGGSLVVRLDDFLDMQYTNSRNPGDYIPIDVGSLSDPDILCIDPQFINPGYWDVNGTFYDLADDFFVSGDYHLKSQEGRWDPNSQTWIIDYVTSPCIDAGDPNDLFDMEPSPNGGRINMGAYGGTMEASMSFDSNLPPEPNCFDPIPKPPGGGGGGR